MKGSSLRDYFASAPGWQRQLAQLRKKCLAGYADGVIRLQDACLLYTSRRCIMAFACPSQFSDQTTTSNWTIDS